MKILGILVYIVGAAVFFLAVYLLGRTGSIIRRGVLTRKGLRKIERDARKAGMVVNQDWHNLKRKAIMQIISPIVLWIGVYIVVFFVLSKELFLISLLALVLPILGYFGIFFVPSD